MVKISRGTLHTCNKLSGSYPSSEIHTGHKEAQILNNSIGCGVSSTIFLFSLISWVIFTSLLLQIETKKERKEERERKRERKNK